MKDRIFQIMNKVAMTQQDFAAELGISPASLSSIFNGRTNPTSNHVRAIHRRFPDISVNWLMFGEGNMYESAESNGEATDAQPAEPDGQLAFGLPDNVRNGADGSEAYIEASASGDVSSSSQGQLPFVGSTGAAGIPVIKEVIKYIDKPQRKITEIRIFFDDGTYETFQGGR